MIIPVLEIKDGKAVIPKSKSGDEYEELKSIICKSSDPLDVAICYEKLGFKEVYIADLDGILYSKPDLDTIIKIRRLTRLSIMVDVGTWSEETLMLLNRVRPVISTEAFSYLNLLEFSGGVILDIDTRNGKLVSESSLDLSDFIDIIKDSKRIQEIILQDLDRFRVSSGPNLELCKKVLSKLPGRRIIYGGGIRNLRDVYSLQRIGIYKVLVGSALHRGGIFKDERKGDFQR